MFDDKSGIDTANWDEYIEDVICLCANAAFQKKYTHFSMQSITKCFSGPNVDKTYDKDGKSSSCIGRGGNPPKGKYEKCISPDLVCVGKEQANYVYGLSNGKQYSFVVGHIFLSLLDIPDHGGHGLCRK